MGGSIVKTYKTNGTCSTSIEIEENNGLIQSVNFVGGCSGNLQGIAKLCVGRKVEDVIELTQGIQCRNGTSCPDQLAKALKTLQ